MALLRATSSYWATSLKEEEANWLMTRSATEWKAERQRFAAAFADRKDHLIVEQGAGMVFCFTVAVADNG